MNVQPFSPGTLTASVAATSASASVAIPLGGSCARIVNSGTSVVFFRLTKGASTAVATDTPLLPNSMEIFAIPFGYDTLSALAVTTSTVYITTGEGQ